MAAKRKADVLDSIDVVYTVSVDLDEFGEDEALYPDCNGEEIYQEQERIKELGLGPKSKVDTAVVCTGRRMMPKLLLKKHF